MPKSVTVEPAPSALAPVAAPSLAGLDLAPAISQAVALGKDGIEVLERLYVMREKERAFDARAAFYDAMANLKAEMRPVEKSTPGQHTREYVTHAGTKRTAGNYAKIDEIAAMLDPLCVKHGLSYRFGREMSDGKEWVVCIVTHRGGHSETTRYPAMDDETNRGKTALHARGSGDTYARRYALTAAFAVVTADPDDDGEAAGRADTGKPVTEDQAANLAAMLDELPDPKLARSRFLAWAHIVSLAELPASRYAECVAAIEAKRKAGRS